MEIDPGLELTVVMPCLNEARTVGRCIEKALHCMGENGVVGEVVLADNGSTDGSPAIAEQAGARVVHVATRGYGSALRGGIEAARGRFLVLGDADDSYDFGALMPFVLRLRAGDELVLGNRFLGGIRPGAMRPLHRYLGNPVLSALGRMIYRTPVGDFHCGMRALRRDAFDRMDLRTTGMEFASEMIVKAALLGMRVGEVPVVLYPDGRDRPSHLRSWRDGWRHLRFLLLYSPWWLFLVPGAVVATIGSTALVALACGPVRLGSVTLDVHTMLYAAVAVILGLQSVTFALFAKVFAVREGLLPPDRRTEALGRGIPLELGLALGIAAVLGGLVGSWNALEAWREVSFGNLEPREILRLVIPSILAIVLGAHLVLTSFFLGLLAIGRK